MRSTGGPNRHTQSKLAFEPQVVRFRKLLPVMLNNNGTSRRPIRATVVTHAEHRTSGVAVSPRMFCALVACCLTACGPLAPMASLFGIWFRRGRGTARNAHGIDGSEEESGVVAQLRRSPRAIRDPFFFENKEPRSMAGDPANEGGGRWKNQTRNDNTRPCSEAGRQCTCDLIKASAEAQVCGETFLRALGHSLPSSSGPGHAAKPMADRCAGARPAQTTRSRPPACGNGMNWRPGEGT